ncbi:hypothetical protein BD779DRAFT_1102271 [Infundibulicybe gibba]|nr:hypothetical protein BD779DRAFT_1102271 [Infundibulicybe gibba]
MTQRWVDRIIYAVVNLHRQTTCRAFIRTIESSPTKRRAFFETHVKALSIAYDIRDDDRTVKILSICRGVTSLTFWVVPVLRVIQPVASYPPFCLAGLHNNELAAALKPLRPKRLSGILYDVLGAPHPQFHLPFFASLTHLSIRNRWQDWVAWDGFHLLPQLTHLSFDFRVNPRNSSLKRNIAVARALQNVLAQCSTSLIVCAVLVLFEAKPSIAGAAAAVLQRLTKPDPRLVFIHDPEPFLDRGAHSLREEMIWELAKQAVHRQRTSAVNIVLEI